VTEHSVPLSAAAAGVLLFGPLVAARDAARVALGLLHGRSPAVAVVRLSVVPGALRRPAPFVFAVRRHRSSIALGFSPAYHLPTE